MALCSQRLVVPYSHRSSNKLTPVKLNPIAKAVFGVAMVTFEVRARYLPIRGKSNF